MKRIKTVLITVTMFTSLLSCDKNDIESPIEEPTTITTEFNDSFEITNESQFRFIDLDKDGTNDILFSLRVSEENLSTFYYYVAEPLRVDVQIVNTGLLDAFAYSRNSNIFDIPINDTQRRWTFNLGILLEKKLTNSTIQRIGMFNGSQSLNLGIRIKKNQEFYYGWIEIQHNVLLNFDQILIKRAAVNKLPSLVIKAGI